jgi:hypothetical protein
MTRNDLDAPRSHRGGRRLWDQAAITEQVLPLGDYYALAARSIVPQAATAGVALPGSLRGVGDKGVGGPSTEGRARSCHRPRYLNIQRLNYLWTIQHSSARIAGNLIT